MMPLAVAVGGRCGDSSAFAYIPKNSYETSYREYAQPAGCRQRRERNDLLMMACFCVTAMRSVHRKNSAIQVYVKDVAHQRRWIHFNADKVWHAHCQDYERGIQEPSTLDESVPYLRLAQHNGC